MGYHNDIITLPYTLEDACEAFDYQTDDLEDLLTNGDVNRWARYTRGVLSEFTIRLCAD